MGLPESLRHGVLNTHSAINNAALIHDIINSYQLDLLALTETWMSADQSRTILHPLGSPSCITIAQRGVEAASR